MRTKKLVSMLLTVAMLVSLCSILAVSGLAAEELQITAAADGTYTKSAEAQDITVRITVSGLEAAYGMFNIEGTTVPEGFVIQSFSCDNSAQAVKAGDYNTANGNLEYMTDDVEDTIPAATVYTMVMTAPANAAGSYSVEFKGLSVCRSYGTVKVGPISSVTANLNIEAPAEGPGYTVNLSSGVSGKVYVDDNVDVKLNVTSSDATVFNALYATVTYNADLFDYVSATSDYTVDSTTAGQLRISRVGDAVTISDDAELTLRFAAKATGTGTFSVSSAKVDVAANAESNAKDATCGTSASVTVSALSTLHFDGNGGTGSVADISAKDGVTVQLPANGFEKSGFEFTGWNDGTNTYAAGADYTVDGDVTFTAQWSAVGQEPTVTASLAEVNYVGEYALVVATIDKAGYVPTYDGNKMYQLSNTTGSVYNSGAYYYVVKRADYDAAKLGYTDGSSILTKSADVNQTGLVDINDAQFVFNIYNGTMPTANVVERLLLADVNNDGVIDSLDCAAVVAAIN